VDLRPPKCLRISIGRFSHDGCSAAGVLKRRAAP
jgi:hypothetical protein